MTKENPSPLILGCMRLAKMTQKELEAWIEAALEQGIHTFDHADIYGQGICEEKFGQILKASPNLRDSVILQSKCGIRDGFYDLSGDYVVKSVDGILKRLNTDYLDVLLLHRPDTLADACGSAAVFTPRPEGGYGFCLVSRTEDLRPLGRELTQQLHGRGGGKPGYQQGSVAADEGEIRAFFAKLPGDWGI